MAVQFILGRSGTGKTTYCVKAIVNELLQPNNNQTLLFLVPEQATYQAERAILSDKRIAGYNRLHVLSFDRLQFWLTGKNIARPAISRIGQQMIIHRILRDNKSKLKIFGSSATWPGLGQQLSRTISELHQYAKTPDDVEQLLGELQKDERNSITILKFADIDLVFREYLKFIEGNFLDPDVQLMQARQKVANSDFVKGAKLWVDGFASFTESELLTLAELLKVVADAQIALCLDPTEINPTKHDAKSIDPTDLFYPTECTYAELIDNIKKCKLRLVKPIILDKTVRFSCSRELAHIEQNIFKGKKEKIPAENSIRIISAPNARAEAQFVAQEILRLVKGKNYRYRDIAVIASDIDSYEHYIRAYFEDYRIPFFIDKRRQLNQYPIVQLICSALQVISGGFSHNDIFSYLKTDLVPVERDDVDLLENYCLAYGITVDDWRSDKDWHFAGEDKNFDEQQINKIRLKVIGPLFALRDGLCPDDNPTKSISADEFVHTISDFIETLQVRQTINNWIKEPQKIKDDTTADEHHQFYDKLISIFDELIEVFAGQEMSCQDYQAIVSSALSQLTLAFIPPTLDQVLVGSIERSRHPDLKAVFLIGTTQRQFPVPISFDKILTEDDRRSVESANFPLAPAASGALAERQYLAYIAFTRPSEFLCVTYPVIDEKGNAVVRSQFIDELQSLFENLTEESIAAEQADIEQVQSETEFAGLLCSRLGRDVSRYSMLDARCSYESSRTEYGDLLNDICADEQLAEIGSNVIYAINYDNRAQLDSAFAKASVSAKATPDRTADKQGVLKELFGKQLRSSATRMGTFAACPYQYFTRYILELKEREEFKLEPLDLGNFYHRVLDSLLKRLNTEKKNFHTIQDEELLRFLREEVSRFVQTDSFISNFSHRSPHNAFIIASASETLEDCVLAIAQMVGAGSFRPTLSEVSFGEVRDSIETLGEYAIDISDKHKLFLDGKIDRLDIVDIDGKKTAIVFDYKRRETLFSWPKLYYGLDMQLPMYLLAVINAKDSKIKEAAGAFYIPVEVPAKQRTLEELSERTDSFSYKAKGIFNGNFAQYLDKQAAKDSKFYNFYVTKDGEPYGIYENRGALRPADFEKILKFTEKKIIQLAEEILCGKIEVRPYRIGTNIPCGYCKYKSVCRFDWQINDYNFLESLNKSQALNKMEG
jgi:ATP-dependent helicase/nuclease subunit B